MKIKLLIAILLSIFSWDSLTAAEKFKIAVVDLQLVFNSYSLKEKAVQQLQTKKEEYLKEVQVREEEIRSLESAFNSKKSSLSPGEYRKQLLELEMKKAQVNHLVDNKNRDLKQLENQLKRPILKKVYAAIERVRQEQGFDIILNKRQVLAYSPEVDLTYLVIKELNHE